MSAVGSRLVDATVLDLFAGSGALGLEALSRGAAYVTMVERARGALDVIRSLVAHFTGRNQELPLDLLLSRLVQTALPQVGEV